RVPCELAATGSLILRPHAVHPVIAAHEVAAGPAQERDAQRPHRLQHVLAKAPGVAQRGAFLVEAAVDAASEMLDEVAEDATVHRADASREIDPDAVHGAESTRGRSRLTGWSRAPTVGPTSEPRSAASAPREAS